MVECFTPIVPAERSSALVPTSELLKDIRLEGAATLAEEALGQYSPTAESRYPSTIQIEIEDAEFVAACRPRFSEQLRAES